jgi:adenylate cyclase
MRECVECFRTGVAFYRVQDWDKAEFSFQTALSWNPDDGLAKIYLERLAEMRRNPPGDDWNGVWVMTHK